MDRTNYVNKAKSLMMKTARTTALVIVPLAAAVSAHAGSIALPESGNPTCSVSGASGSCFSGDAQLADLGSGIQGLSFFTSGGSTQTLFMFTSGASLPVNMTMGDSGILGGTIVAGTLIPVSWDFNMTPLSGSGTIDSWILTFGLGSSAGATNFGSASTSGGSIGSSGSTINGGPINLQVLSDLASGSTLFESVSLTMDVTTNLGVQVTVFNATSWDFNSVAAASVPEPATTGLIGAGLAFFGALLRRRRKQ
jgi:PEP-CTERM motif